MSSSLHASRLSQGLRLRRATPAMPCDAAGSPWHIRPLAHKPTAADAARLARLVERFALTPHAEHAQRVRVVRERWRRGGEE